MRLGVLASKPTPKVGRIESVKNAVVWVHKSCVCVCGGGKGGGVKEEGLNQPWYCTESVSFSAAGDAVIIVNFTAIKKGREI